MPRFRRRKIPTPATTVTVAAVSEVRKTPGTLGSVTSRQAWQTEAWRQYDLSGELRYAVNWKANSVSRARLYVAEVDERGQVTQETSNTDVLDLVEGMLGTPGQQSDFLRRLSLQLEVPGDSYVLTEPTKEGYGPFQVYSTDELTVGLANEVMISTGLQTRTVTLDDALVQRVWIPHPRKRDWADSPVRAALPVLREMEELTKYIFATINSRLAGAGILGLPSEMSFPQSRQDLQPGETPFMATLAEAMLASITDVGSAAALVPIVINAPAEALAAMQWLTHPNSELRAEIAELRDKAIRRLALDLDIPAEVLLGSGDANRYNVWQIEEQSIKLSIEPMLMVMCAALTEGFLAPSLEAADLDPSKYVFWFDTTELVLRPDRSTDAKDAYDRGELSSEALLMYLGFTETDAPKGQAKALSQVLRLVALSPTAADLMMPALIKLMDLDKYGITPEMLTPRTDPGGTGGTPPQDEPPDPNPAPRNNPNKPAPQSPRPPVANPTPK